MTKCKTMQKGEIHGAFPSFQQVQSCENKIFGQLKANNNTSEKIK